MDDLISEFITETNESLAVLDLELVKLEQNPQDVPILSNIFRVMHTIKGTCGFLGLPRLESVAHASENVLGKIRDKELTASSDAVSLILESLDTIKGLIEHLSANGSEQAGDDKALIARLNHFAETGTIGAAPVANGVAHGTANGVANGVANGTNGVGHDPFPHFKGEDDPIIAEAIKKMMADQNIQNASDLAVTPTYDEESAEKAAAAPAAVKAAPTPAKAETKDNKEHAPEQKEGAGGGATQSIRVNIDVLESLMQMVSELVLTRNQLMQIVRTKEDKDFMTPLQQLSHITSELQDGVMKTRMQPIGNAWSKFPRLIRDLSIELSKKIDLKMNGAETELDRQLLEVIKDPLTHMVRNSCDHGLEPPAERIAAGKPEIGTVTLSAYHEGGHIIIEIMDDGRGIPIEKVKKKALANGLATEAALEAMTEKQIAQFVFAAGFSTAEKITSVSGRGVGMDVVKTNIEKIGGTLDLDTTWGKGSKISVKIPLTLAIVSVLLVEVCGQKFAIPQINVLELVRVTPDGLNIETINDALVLRLRGKLLPLAILSQILGSSIDPKELLTKEMFIAVCKVGEYDFGILVDRVYDTEEIVVKPVADILKNISVYAGNTILGDGSVIMILDPNSVAKTINHTEITAHTNAALAERSRMDSEATVGFLLFNTGHGAPKAVPLELVSRLEEIDVKDIEIAGDQPVVQYRGELMRLITLGDDFAMPATGHMDVIVFNYDKKIIGLVVKEIMDIVHAPFVIKLTSKEAKSQGFLGSVVISGKSTDVVDVGNLLSDFIDQTVSDSENISKEKVKECSILLVEDSPFFRNLTVPFLAAVGYKVTAAEDAEQAVKIISREDSKFDMIVTDLEMPGMNGFEFANYCRNTQSIRNIPIIAYTASLSNEVVKRSKDVGMNECIIKTDRVGLLQSVSKHLAQEKAIVRH